MVYYLFTYRIVINGDIDNSVKFEDTQKADHNLKSSLDKYIQSFIDSYIVIYLFISHCLLGDHVPCTLTEFAYYRAYSRIKG